MAKYSFNAKAANAAALYLLMFVGMPVAGYLMARAEGRTWFPAPAEELKAHAVGPGQAAVMRPEEVGYVFDFEKNEVRIASDWMQAAVPMTRFLELDVVERVKAAACADAKEQSGDVPEKFVRAVCWERGL